MSRHSKALSRPRVTPATRAPNPGRLRALRVSVVNRQKATTFAREWAKAWILATSARMTIRVGTAMRGSRDRSRISVGGGMGEFGPLPPRQRPKQDLDVLALQMDQWSRARAGQLAWA